MRQDILQRFYLQGYQGKIWPRWLRRCIGKTEIHRAWLLGHLGFFSEAGAAYGPCRPYDLKPAKLEGNDLDY